MRPERFFGTEKVWIGEARVAITDLERTLLDGLSMPQYCGDFAEILSSNGLRLVALDLDFVLARLRLSDVVGCL